MKIFSAAKTLKPAAARNCFLLNQFATPGLGSLVGGRILAGFGQLLLAVAGFAFIIIWFIQTMHTYYSLMDSDNPAPSSSNLHYFLAGAALFAVSWLWSLITSISLMRNAKVPEPPPPGSVPPRITDQPPKM